MNRWISYVLALVLAVCLVPYWPMLGGFAVAAGLVMPVLVRTGRHA